MKGRLGLAVVASFIMLSALAPAGAWHQGHRHWSTIPDGPYAVLPGVAREFVASDGVVISYGVHMPDVPAGTKVPIILSAGPYFLLSEEPVNVPSSSRLTGFLIDNFVSHGYAVVAASTRGTGWSGGCMELMSQREAMDLDELVTFLGNEPWSNGNVAMTGKSYDGSTPWMVAQFGNPHLKTIVPLQGVTDQGDLLVHRGAAQWRTPIFHSVVYWASYGFGTGTARSADDQAANAVCPEVAEGQATALWSTYTGDTQLAPVAKEYWDERAYRERVLENYAGSVFIVHSLQDFNVIPSQVVPFFNDLQVEKKMWLGQWAHQYPDEGVFSQRNDFAQVLKAWFDRHLKDLPVATGPIVEVADHRTGAWRSTTEWPETPVETKRWNFSSGGQLTTGAPSAFSITLASPGGLGVLSRPCTAATSPNQFSTIVPTSFRASGLGGVDVRLDPATHGTLVVSVCANGRLIGHGGASTLYPNDNTLEPFVPGLPLDVHVDLEPLEYTVPAGARLTVAVRFEDYLTNCESGSCYWPGTSPGVGVLKGGALRLPVV